MSGVSSQTGTVDFVFLFIVGISIFFLVLITFLLIFFIIKYNKKRRTKAKDIPGNTVLEITWTVIPTILVLFMFYFGWKGFQFLRNAPEDSMKVNVTARMWSWSFEYENRVTVDTLRVPVNTPVKLLLNSLDVIHSFYVPAFRVKEDAVPGFQNYLWFEANKTGSYQVLCAEYCGLRHAYMLSQIQVVPKEEFNTWYADLEKTVSPETTVQAEPTEEKRPTGLPSGEKLIKTYGCVACHTTDGSQLVGPSFKNLFGKEVTLIEKGRVKTVTADEDYIRQSILEPNLQLVKGFNPLMPSQKDRISEKELVAIIQYIKELK